MVIWFDFMPNLSHNAIFIDQEGLAIDAKVLFAIHVLLTIHTIKLCYRCIGIGKQRVGQTVFLSKFLMRGNAICTHTEYNSPTLLHLTIGITEAARFFCTAGCVILWV